MWFGTRFLQKCSSRLLKPLIQSNRTIFIIERETESRLPEPGKRYVVDHEEALVYKLKEDTIWRKKGAMRVLLVKDYPGLGKPGDVIEVNHNFAYENLLLPKFAVYVTPENLAKYSSVEVVSAYSSKFALPTKNELSTKLIPVIMNDRNPWTIQKWHIKTFLRKAGVFAVDDAITLPETLISGPKKDMHGKEFPITITINNMETVKVRCRLYLLQQGIIESTLYQYDDNVYPPVLPEFKEILDTMPPLSQKKDDEFNPTIHPKLQKKKIAELHGMRKHKRKAFRTYRG